MSKFKVHMVKYWDEYGTFITMCGIDETCSEDFYDDPNSMTEFGNTDETTCKNCLKNFESNLKLTSRDYELIGEAIIKSHE
jgi:hypothetical protein